MSSAMKDFADKFTRFVKDVDVSFDDHDARIKALEKDNETRVSYISVQPNMSKFQFTQADLDNAVKAERMRCKRRVSETMNKFGGPNGTAWDLEGRILRAIDPTE